MNTIKEIEIYKETSVKILARSIKKYLFGILTKKSNKLFLRGKDTIGIAPQLFGIHEEPLTNAIKYYVATGYKNFLIDIGANIGLTSCQNGDDFTEIHVFEPNPLCCNILEVNTKIALKSTKIFINRYGLGDSDKKSTLTVPRHNWGGAFVRDNTNSYTDKILAFKDGFDEIDNKNYFEIDILIKDTERELKELFKSLTQKGFNQGVIKIDVEGYEEVVLIGIANAIPSNMKIVILFESWDDNFNLSKVKNAFSGACKLRKINRMVPWKRGASKINKILSLLVSPIIRYKITDIKDGSISGDLILEVN